MNEYFKVLEHDGTCYHGGSTSWHLPRGARPGKWMPKIDTPLKPCFNGYHILRRQDVIYWLGPSLWAVEVRGEPVWGENKGVVAQARLIKRLVTWNDRTVRLFAADCAEMVLPLYEQQHPNDLSVRAAIEAARLHALDGQAPEEIELAGARAWESASKCDPNEPAEQAARAAGYCTHPTAWWAAFCAAGCAINALTTEDSPPEKARERINTLLWNYLDECALVWHREMTEHD